VSVIIQVLWAQAQVKMASGLGAALGILVGLLLRRRQRPWFAAAGLTLSLCVVLGVTLFGWRGFGGAGPGPLSRCTVALSEALLVARLLDAGGGANVALFVPLGFFATLLLQRPLVAVAGLALLSVAIEVAQALGGAQDCSSVDLVSNAIGALVGVFVAVVTISGVRRARRPSRTPEMSRQ
jgi:energy-converting hydrogenase Eha subunit C